MISKIKKSILLVLILSCVFTIVGCNKNSGKKSTEEGATTIKVWVRSFEDWSDNLLEKQVKEFNENLTDGIQIVLKFYGDDNAYDTAIASGFENDSIADIFMAQYDRIYTYYRAGYIAPIGDYLSEEIKKKYIDSAREAVTYLDNATGENKMYAMPWILEPSMMLYYRTDIFNKAGISKAPTTWDELLDACEKASKQMDRSRNQFTIAVPSTAVEYTWTTFGMLQNVTGGQVVDESWMINRVKGNENSFKQCAKFWYDLSSRGYTPSASLTPEGYIDSVDAMADGKVAMAISGSFGIGRLMNYYPDEVDRGLFGVCAMPMPTTNNKCTSVNGGWTYVLSSSVSGEKAEKATTFLNWLLCNVDVASKYFDAAYYSKSATRTDLVQYIEEKTQTSKQKEWIACVNDVALNGIMVQPISWNVEYQIGSLFEYVVNHSKDKSFDALYNEKINEVVDNIDSIISQPGYSRNPKYSIK